VTYGTQKKNGILEIGVLLREVPALIMESARVVDLRKTILGIIAEVCLSLLIQAEKSLSTV
jgi:hypothetical protein